MASVGEVGWITIQGLRLPGGYNLVFGFVGGCQGGFRVAWQLRPRVWNLAGGYRQRPPPDSSVRPAVANTLVSQMSQTNSVGLMDKASDF